MNYQEIKPCKQLTPYIDSFWIQECLKNAAFESYPPTKILPTAMIKALFHYRDPFYKIVGGQKEMLPKCYISGQKTKPVEHAASGQTGIVIVNFYPWGAAPFFKYPMDEPTDLTIDLSLLIGSRIAAAVEDEIQIASSANERIDVIQNLLIGLLDEGRSDKLVAESALRINRSDSIIPISQLAEDLYISRRQFIRRFKKTIGICPKKFSNIIRFQKALHYKRLGMSWSEIVFNCGYYDQSHFIKEFSGFSDYTPQNISSDKPQTELMKYFNSNRSLSHFYNTTYL